MLRESQDKFKRSNIKQSLVFLLEQIKAVIKVFDKSSVLEDCVSLIEEFKTKVEKVNGFKKKIKQGDRQCMEVLRQQKDVEETIKDILKERKLVEISLQEL